MHRIAVPDDKVRWEAPWPDYNPPEYTADTLKGKPWADQAEDLSRYKWNSFDGEIDRRSHFTYVSSGMHEKYSSPLQAVQIR